MLKSGIYTGLVVHQRLRPKQHRLAYRVFSLLIDLDELDAMKSSLRMLRIGRLGLLSFHEKDHGDGKDLRAWINLQLHAAGIEADGPVRLLCYPRMFGYVFNPLSVYYCHDRDETLRAIIYEVHNTHGERHAYVLPAGEATETVRHACDKAFFVSPFMPMECRYNFVIRRPGDTVQVLINEDDAEGPLLKASFTGKRTPLTDAALIKALVSHPLMTLKVTAGIHFEAIKLVLKGFRIFHHPPGGKPNEPPSVQQDTKTSTGDRPRGQLFSRAGQARESVAVLPFPVNRESGAQSR